MSTEQQIEFLEARLSAQERFLETLMTVVMPALQTAVNEQGGHIGRFIQAFVERAKVEAKDRAVLTERLNDVGNAVEAMGRTMGMIADEGERGEWWKRGGETDS
jgi:hypothetical protein